MSTSWASSLIYVDEDRSYVPLMYMFKLNILCLYYVLIYFADVLNTAKCWFLISFSRFLMLKYHSWLVQALGSGEAFQSLLPTLLFWDVVLVQPNHSILSTDLCRFKSIVGIGVGAGAYILAKFAVSHLLTHLSYNCLYSDYLFRMMLWAVFSLCVCLWL